MDSSWQRQAGITSSPAVERMKELLKAAEEKLNSIENQISNEKAKMVTYNNAVSNLEKVIPNAKKILKIHEENRIAFLAVQSRSIELPSLLEIQIVPESTTEALFSKLQGYASGPELWNDESIKGKALILGEKVPLLRDHLHLLEVEMDGWRLSLSLSVATLKHLNKLAEPLRKFVENAKSPFRPLWRVSAGVWKSIFKLTQEIEYEDYIVTGENNCLVPMAYNISHVCYYWKLLVYEEPSLWSIVGIPPTIQWKESEYNCVTTSLKNSNASFTLVTNVYQPLNSAGYFQSQNSTNRSIKVDEEDDIFNGNKYKLHVTMQSNERNYTNKLAGLPFHRAKEVVLSAKQPLEHRHLMEYLKVPSATALTIINDYPVSIPKIANLSPFPRLRSISFRVKQLPTFKLAEYLPSWLEELNLLPTIRSPVSSLDGAIKLPKLHTLGITPASMDILGRVETADLRTIVLHGDDDPDEDVQILSGEKEDQNYGRLVHLEFRDWGKMEKANGDAGAASLLTKLIPKVPRVESIKFMDSFVDGEALVTLFKHPAKISGNGALKFLKEVTLNSVSGITRDQCDVLKDLVPKLNIYV